MLKKLKDTKDFIENVGKGKSTACLKFIFKNCMFFQKALKN